jgi:hypothetical protein
VFGGGGHTKETDNHQGRFRQSFGDTTKQNTMTTQQGVSELSCFRSKRANRQSNVKTRDTMLINRIDG